jgi:hypothetical protein
MTDFNYDISIENKFIFIEAAGHMNISDYKSLFSRLGELNERFISEMNIVFDASQIKANYSVKELSQIERPFVEATHNFEYLKFAKICNSPLETALSIVFSENVRYLRNVELKIFNTKEEALKWINMN